MADPMAMLDMEKRTGESFVAVYILGGVIYVL